MTIHILNPKMVKCIRCGIELDVSIGLLKQMYESSLEEMGPQDILDELPYRAGRCKKEGFEDKKHAFVFTDEHNKRVENLIDEYDSMAKATTDLNAVLNGVVAEKEEWISKKNEAEIKIPELYNKEENLSRDISEINEQMKSKEVEFLDLMATKNMEKWRRKQ